MSTLATNNGADVEKGGRFHHQQEYSAAPPVSQFRQIANPGPLGLSAFALTTFVLSLVRDISFVSRVSRVHTSSYVPYVPYLHSMDYARHGRHGRHGRLRYGRRK